jgi:peptidoglycan/LPS O-acetylase OafA/YrhL
VLSVRTHGELAAGSDGVVTIGLTATAFLSGSVLLIALTSDTSGWLARGFGHPALRTFGKYSYCLYVVHPFVGLALLHWIDDAGWVRRVDGYETPARIAFSVVATVFVLGVAWASWQLLESPILRFKRLFPYGEARGAGARGRNLQPGSTPKEAGV